MNARTHVLPYLSNSLAIRHEIQRFESVHPSIYAIYDLIELIPDPVLIQQIKEHVVSIEDSFVNSQEWTLSRAVPDLRLGIVGSLSSGKSALVHRYLTGSYMQEESPEGGRFKKEIVVDGQSYLLLIRDEGGPPELQFTSWVDAVIFVFSLENESSFNAIYNYYAKMAHYRNTSEIPLILVGTQDAISESNPRVIDDSRARKLANDLKRCSYYETCATYGLNVERVFQDACQKIAQQRMAAVTPSCNSSRPGTPNHSLRSNYYIPSPTVATTITSTNNSNTSTNNGYSSSHTSNASSSSPNTFVSCSPSHSGTGTGSSFSIGGQQQPQSQVTFREPNVVTPKDTCWDRGDTLASVRPTEIRCEKSATNTSFGSSVAFTQTHALTPTPISLPMPTPVQTTATAVADRHSHPPTVLIPALDSLPPQKEHQPKDLPTPSSTPTTARKTRRRSNLFTPSRKQEENKKLKNGEMGSGRAIPIKQGYLYKRSCKALNKDWKKKYVTLCDDGRLTYHSSLNDYMDDIHGKEIPLMHTTVKIPGQKPRGTKSQSTQSSNMVNGLERDVSSLSISALGKDKSREKDILLREGHCANRSGSVSSACDDAFVISNTSLMNGGMDGNVMPNPVSGKIETPNVKKRHRRMKSSGTKNLDNMDDSDGYEFVIVSLDNKQWHFDAPSTEERESWVQAIEQQILNSLQGNESSKSKSRSNNLVDAAVIQSIRSQVRGNTHCVDCDTPNPDWASLNLGALMCIECSGIHRNLGSHISRVRSLDLDEWPPWFIKVMTSVGNVMANSIWEGNVRGKAKPTPNSSREEKERWIRAKYEHKELLIPIGCNVPLPQQLVDAVCKSDVKSVLLLLAHATPDQVNATVSSRDLRTPLHLAAALGNLAITQLLLWNNASVKAADQENRTALTYARNSGSQEVQELLVQNGCSEMAPPSGTLPRRRGSVGNRKGGDVFDKLPASVI